MSEITQVYTWDHLPNRDEALDRVYAFVRALGHKDPEEAGRMVSVKDMGYFMRVLHDGLLSYLDMVIEDDEWERYEGLNLAEEVDDPANLPEEDSMPEFGGVTFDMVPGESLSILLGIRGQITPVRLHFSLSGDPTACFLRLVRITAREQ